MKVDIGVFFLDLQVSCMPIDGYACCKIKGLRFQGSITRSLCTGKEM